MPLVTVWPTPKGSPTASTRSPTWIRSESPNWSAGEVRARIGQQDARGVLAAIGESDPDLGASVDDVVVGQDHPIAAHDDARAQGLLDPGTHRAFAEELLEERIDRLTNDAI
jgi:hypothetical protein